MTCMALHPSKLSSHHRRQKGAPPPFRHRRNQRDTWPIQILPRHRHQGHHHHLRLMLRDPALCPAAQWTTHGQAVNNKAILPKISTLARARCGGHKTTFHLRRYRADPTSYTRWKRTLPPNEVEEPPFPRTSMFSIWIILKRPSRLASMQLIQLMPHWSKITSVHPLHLDATKWKTPQYSTALKSLVSPTPLPAPLSVTGPPVPLSSSSSNPSPRPSCPLAREHMELSSTPIWATPRHSNSTRSVRATSLRSATPSSRGIRAGCTPNTPSM